MREKMRMTMRVKGVQNLRQILLIILFGALSCYLTIRAIRGVSAIGQSERARAAPQTQRPGETQTKPPPTPPAAQTPKKAEAPPAQEQDVSIKINSNLVIRLGQCSRPRRRREWR